MSDMDTISTSLRTDTGKVRDHNEDYVASWEPKTPEEQAELGWLYIVADGVGGAEAGDVASQHATEQTIDHYLSDSANGDPAARLINAIQAANDDLRRLARQHGRGGYMATTMVAAAIRANHALIANVGDSRGYHISNGQIRQITSDHSLVAQLVAEGAITAEEAVVHPRRNVILASLGPTRDPRIDLFEVALDDGDVLLLCSDGLTRYVSDEEIASVVRSMTPDDATTRLIEMANTRGGSDNISVALVQVGVPPVGVPPVGAASVGVAPFNAALTAPPAMPLVVPTAAMPESLPRNRAGLWVYTIFLALVEALLIVIVYYLLRV